MLVENDGASGFACVERAYYVRTVVLATPDGSDGAGSAVDVDAGEGEGDKCEEGDEPHC